MVATTAGQRQLGAGSETLFNDWLLSPLVGFKDFIIYVSIVNSANSYANARSGHICNKKLQSIIGNEMIPGNCDSSENEPCSRKS